MTNPTPVSTYDLVFVCSKPLHYLARFVQRCEAHLKTPGHWECFQVTLGFDGTDSVVYFCEPGPGATIAGLGVTFSGANIIVGNRYGRILSVSYGTPAQEGEVVEKLFKKVLDHFVPAPIPQLANAELIPRVLAEVFRALEGWDNPPGLEARVHYRKASEARLELLATTGERHGAWAHLLCADPDGLHLRSGRSTHQEIGMGSVISRPTDNPAVLRDIAKAMLVVFLPSLP